jgi:hypothetical protein
MANNQEPVILELAPLPREQIGPFLLLGLVKTADQEEIEANWAQRVIWARKKQFRIPLEDVNWAREVINDPERRVRADVLSVNADTSDGVLRRLVQRYGGAGGRGPAWQPLDREKPLADYAPATDVPDAAEVKSAIHVPDVPREMPAVPRLLEGLLREPLDPWNLPISSDPNRGSAE